MARRVCSSPRCPNLTEAGSRGGRCTKCRREHEAARGTTTEQGYGWQHQRLRAEWQQRIDAGELVICWRCEKPIAKGEPMDLGHDETDRTITRGPEHANRCNRSAAGRARRPTL